ncbi:NADH-quinone oxidoreductase subunit J family protein [Deferrisoma camini]|uniref:NADH-quinone oxidoreductase subunit J family protein n=1 Tax=Deferrisoma camini TaxID=1035120 RepID=UPI00046CD374|nr:NADH-quinone oxidoreductase subunit J [Deferrisoma camini]
MTFTFDPSLRLYIYLADAAFLGFVFLALAGGVVAVGAKRLIHAVLGLATSLVGVAGLYVYLGTHFIAAMQILIYVGAVCISIVFAVMLARPPSEAEKAPRAGPGKLMAGFGVGLFAALVLGSAVFATRWQAEPTAVAGTLQEVGEGLLTRYAFVFELISLVLLVAIVGSVVLARRGRRPAGG